MARLYEIAKRVALRRLPQRLLKQVKKRHYLKKVIRTSVLDESDLGILSYLVNPGDCVVDIGANVGVYTAHLSRLVADTGRVYSIEPVPTTFDFLSHNVSSLGLTNVLVMRVAITDHACRASMMIPKDSGGVENFYQATVVEEGDEGDSDSTLVVDGLPLDRVLLDDVGRIRFIKCDIEGYELHCLRGAAEVLSLSRPAWLMEVCGYPDQLGSHAANVFSFMGENGYCAWCYQQGKLKPWASGVQNVNYLFLTVDHIERLRNTHILPCSP